MKSLYPFIEPFAIHSLDVEGGHSLYVEECGNPSGLPVLFLHGGPAAGCKPYQRSFFDPEKYHIILFDQRGSGRSVPHGFLHHNRTQDLLADIETIRQHFNIARGLLFAGSWGATLALLYAQKHPGAISGLILRGTFLARARDMDWFIRDGANRIYPERWSEVSGVIAKSDQKDNLKALHELIEGEDEIAKRRAVKAWSNWASQLSEAQAFNPKKLEEHVDASLIRQVRLELHYAIHHYFLNENQILETCKDLPNIPTILIHGRQDMVCPVESSYALKNLMPEADLRILPNSGHIATGDEMIDALVNAADEMIERISP